MIAEFSIVPVGKGVSISPYVADCINVLRESGVHHQLTPMGTIIEGEDEEVLAVILACHRKVMEKAERVITNIKIDDRKGVTNAMETKIVSVERRLKG